MSSISYTFSYKPEYSHYTITNLVCCILFPIGIILAIYELAKKIIHNITTKKFIPAFKVPIAERVNEQMRMEAIIQAKKTQYVFERIIIPCGKKVKLDGMKIMPKSCPNPKRWLVFSHGNAGSIPRLLEHPMLFPLLDKLQVGVLVSDYQGVGRSTRKTPTRNGLLRNAIATMEYAAKELKAEEIIKWGFSFGGAVDTHLNFSLPPGIKLIKVVDRTFSSIEAVIESKTRDLALSNLASTIGWHLDPVQGVWNNKAPMLILFHRLDGTVLFEASLAAQFLDRRPPEVTLFELKGDDVYWTNEGLALAKRYHSRPYRFDELQAISDWIDRAFASLSPAPTPAYNPNIAQ